MNLRRMPVMALLLVFLIVFPVSGAFQNGMPVHTVYPSGDGNVYEYKIVVSNAGQIAGYFIETFPSGIKLISSSLPPESIRAEENNVYIALAGGDSFDFTIRTNENLEDDVTVEWKDLVGDESGIFYYSPGKSVIPSGTLPLDSNNNGIIEYSELSFGIITSLDRDKGAPSERDLRDAAWIWYYHDGRPWTVTDSTGEETIMYRPIRNAVVLNADILETMRSLGVSPDMISGVPDSVIEDPGFFPEYNDKANIGSVWETDYEKIISLSPDAVFLYAGFMSTKCDEIQARLQESDPSIRVFRFDCYDPENYAVETSLLADLLDRRERGDEFLSFYEESMKLVRERTSGIAAQDKTSIYFESWDEFKSCANGSGYNEKIKIAGGKNVFEAATPAYPLVDPESVFSASPEVIVKLIGAGSYKFGGYAGDGAEQSKALYDLLESRTGWQDIDAVKNGRLHIMHNDIFGGPGHFIGIMYITKWLYPGEFSDMEPEEVHREYLEVYQGLEFEDFSGSVFVYPGMA
ncbi:MAG: ABC transporter substrate-binding protein [Methanomicrobiaceae archaeon]|nr:ABC transporter substrate-binding protein [Methanomicrobiaceae archaeon]